jgi:hypothetical protein
LIKELNMKKMVEIRWNALGGYELVIDRQNSEGSDYTDFANRNDYGYDEAEAEAEALREWYAACRVLEEAQRREEAASKAVFDASQARMRAASAKCE